MSMKGEVANPKPSQSQGTPGSYQKTEERLDVWEEKFNVKAAIPSPTMVKQHHVCGEDHLDMEEEVPRRTLPNREPPGRFLPIDNQKEQMDDQDQCDLPSHLDEEGQDSDFDLDVMEVSLSPQQEVLANSRSSELRPEVRERYPDLLGPGMSRNGNHFLTQPRGEGEALTGAGETEGKVDEDFCLLCSGSHEGGPTRASQLSTAGPGGGQEHSLRPSQEEFSQQIGPHAGNGEDYYDYIEEFLGEGTLVSIDSARTYVDLQSGTIKTSVEVSAEDDGVAVKHEVEWVTRFQPTWKQK